jgi:hypothetical protein
MTNPLIRIHDLSSDELVDREMTSQELAFYKKDQEAIIAEEQAIKDKADARLALLTKLGISEDEAKLLLL